MKEEDPSREKRKELLLEKFSSSQGLGTDGTAGLIRGLRAVLKILKKDKRSPEFKPPA